MLPRAAEKIESKVGTTQGATRGQALRLVGAESEAPCVTPASCEEDEWAALLSRVHKASDLTEEEEWAAQMARVRAEIEGSVEGSEEREWARQAEQVKKQLALDEEREWRSALERMRAAELPGESSQVRRSVPTSMVAPKPGSAVRASHPAEARSESRSTLMPSAPSEEPAGLRFTLPEEKARVEAQAAQKVVAPNKLPPRTSASALPRVSSPLPDKRVSQLSPVRSTSYLARQSMTPRPSPVPARPVAKSTLPAAPQRPEVQRLLARAKPRTEQRAPTHSGVHRVSEVQGAPRTEQDRKKDSSLVELSRVLESAPPPPARASRNLPPAPPRTSWQAPSATTSRSARPAVAKSAAPAATKSAAPAAVAKSAASAPVAPLASSVAADVAALEQAAAAAAASAFREEKTMRGPAIAPPVVTKSGKAPLRLPPLPPRGQVSNKPRPQLPPLPTRAGSKAPAKGQARTARKPLAIPAPPPRSAAQSGQRPGIAQSVWSAVASFTNRGGSHR